MKQWPFLIIAGVIFESCNHQPGKPTQNNAKRYIMTIYRDRYEPASRTFKPDNEIDSIQADNDTVAYLNCLKIYYNKKIAERKNFNYGQPKSFLTVGKDGVDLTVKLPDKVVKGLKNQVENMPDVKEMIEAYRKDSL